jgi:hypothetical protein
MSNKYEQRFFSALKDTFVGHKIKGKSGYVNLLDLKQQYFYERTYSDRDDVALFWKTQKLYYVKSGAMYDDLETEANGITYFLDASDIKHTKGNEKKSLLFYLVDAQPNLLPRLDTKNKPNTTVLKNI